MLWPALWVGTARWYEVGPEEDVGQRAMRLPTGLAVAEPTEAGGDENPEVDLSDFHMESVE